MNYVNLTDEYCKKPTLIGQNLWKSCDAGSGCSVLDVEFPRLMKIAGISFKNYYTAKLQIWLKYAQKMKSNQQNKAGVELVWIAAIPKIVLMPHPHFEKGGSENFTVLLPSSPYVASMKIVLKQPSFQWKQFFIYQISIVEDLPCNFHKEEHFTDIKSKRKSELVKFLGQQTKKCLNVREHGNESNAERGNNVFLYELSLFPSID